MTFLRLLVIAAFVAAVNAQVAPLYCGATAYNGTVGGGHISSVLWNVQGTDFALSCFTASSTYSVYPLKFVVGCSPDHSFSYTNFVQLADNLQGSLNAPVSYHCPFAGYFFVIISSTNTNANVVYYQGTGVVTSSQGALKSDSVSHTTLMKE